MGNKSRCCKTIRGEYSRAMDRNSIFVGGGGDAEQGSDADGIGGLDITEDENKETIVPMGVIAALAAVLLGVGLCGCVCMYKLMSGNGDGRDEEKPITKSRSASKLDKLEKDEESE